MNFKQRKFAIGYLAITLIAILEPPRQALFLDVPSMAQREYSEETLRRIDNEIRNRFEVAHERVRQTLTAKREVLASLAKLLIEKEVVSRDDLTALLASAEV
jgi:ATP-dependent Zn protease